MEHVTIGVCASQSLHTPPITCAPVVPHRRRVSLLPLRLSTLLTVELRPVQLIPTLLTARQILQVASHVNRFFHMEFVYIPGARWYLHTVHGKKLVRQKLHHTVLNSSNSFPISKSFCNTPEVSILGCVPSRASEKCCNFWCRPHCRQRRRPAQSSVG